MFSGHHPLYDTRLASEGHTLTLWRGRRGEGGGGRGEGGGGRREGGGAAGSEGVTLSREMKCLFMSEIVLMTTEVM